MDRNQLKTLKKLDTMNFTAKNIYTRYYLRYNGEMASSLDDIKDANSMNYIRFDEDIQDLYELLKLELTDVLYIDSFATAKALGKRTKIKDIITLDGKIVVVSGDPKVVEIADEYGWFAFNGEVNIPIARIETEDKCRKIFSIARVGLDVSDMEDVSELIDAILDKYRVGIVADSETLFVGKPLFPTLNNKCQMYARFFPLNDAEFLAHICIVKEQIFNYHTFIGYTSNRRR